jgi:hypothetical protein
MTWRIPVDVDGMAEKAATTHCAANQKFADKSRAGAPAPRHSAPHA